MPAKDSLLIPDTDPSAAPDGYRDRDRADCVCKRGGRQGGGHSGAGCCLADRRCDLPGDRGDPLPAGRVCHGAELRFDKLGLPAPASHRRDGNRDHHGPGHAGGVCDGVR